VQKRKDLSASEIRRKIYRYCAYQERSHLEVKNKLFGLGANRDVSDEILGELITQGFLNEERFACAYTGGKFRLKSWGRLKIIRGLESKGLTSNCIKAGLREIDDEDYRKTIVGLVRKKAQQWVDSDLYARREKVANYLIQKGFEPDLVWEIIKRENIF
jgi:regulatory protein